MSRKTRAVGAQLQHRAIATFRALSSSRETKREGKGGGGKRRECVTSKMRRCRRYEGRFTVSKRMAELRVTGLNDSMEMVVAVAQAGGCRIGEITAGLLRTVPRSLGSVWLRCSLTTARKINAVEGGKLRLGWTAARVHPLLTHRLQCFKYLEARHGATGAANQDIGPGTVRRGCLDVCYVQTWGCPRRIEWSYQHASRQPRKGRGDRKRESAATEEERRHLRRLAQ